MTDTLTMAAPSSRPGTSLFEDVPQTTAFNRLRKRLNRLTREAISRYHMTFPNDGEDERWLVCLSGGKDSWAMLGILSDLKAQGLLGADLLACNLDQGQPGFPRETIPDFLDAHASPTGSSIATLIP